MNSCSCRHTPNNSVTAEETEGQHVLAINGGTPTRTKSFTTWPVYGEKEEKAVVDVVRSGKWGLGGQRTSAFESRFAQLHSARYGITVVNGTVALQVSLLALGVGPGDEVIIPAYTFVATGAAVMHVGAVPVIVDIDPNTYTIDPEAIEAAITPRTKCIIPVHVAGNVADMNRIRAMAAKHQLPILEDAAQAHAAEWEGQGVGSLGTLGTFSFQASKNLNAGEGGIVLTNDLTLANRCRALRNCGRTDDPAVGRVLGWNFRMAEFQAAILLAQMDRLEQQTQLRNTNAESLSAGLAQIPGIRPLERYPAVTRHAYHLYIFRYDAAMWGVPLQTFVQALAAEGIPCSQGYVPLYRDPLLVTTGTSYSAAGPDPDNRLAEQGVATMTLPCAEQASQEAVWLPHMTLLGDAADISDIVSAVRRLWTERSELQKLGHTGGALRYAGLEG